LKKSKEFTIAIEDKIKWDEKYKQNPDLLKKRPASQKLIQVLNHISQGKVLEIACGTGRNSIYLAQNGFDIDAFDISSVALNTLNEKGFSNIHTKQVDLEKYPLPNDYYNLIVMTNYLDRELIPTLCSSLKKDGFIFIETYMEHPSNTKKHSNNNFLLQANELKTFFNTDFQVIEYDEFDNESYEQFRMKKQSIIIKKL